MIDQNPSPGDNISLGSIKKALLDIFRIFFRLLEFFSYAIRKSIILICVFVLLGLVAGYLYNTSKQKNFEAEMIVQQNDLSKKIYYEIISNLNSLIAADSYSDLAKELKLPVDVVSKINLIDAVSINNESLKKDTSTRLRQPFKITVALQGTDVLDTLQKGLLNYLNSNPMTRQVRQKTRAMYEERLVTINKEAARLDSLKDVFSNFLRDNRISATVYSNAMNPADLYSRSAELESQRENVLRWLNAEQNSVDLIDGFKIPVKPKKPPLFVALVLGGIIGFLLGSMFALIRLIRDKI